MAREPTNHRAEWTKENLRELKQLAKENTPTRVIALRMGRSEDAIRAKAGAEGISLKPVNQSPYGTKAAKR